MYAFTVIKVRRITPSERSLIVVLLLTVNRIANELHSQSPCVISKRSSWINVLNNGCHSASDSNSSRPELSAPSLLLQVPRVLGTWSCYATYTYTLAYKHRNTYNPAERAHEKEMCLVVSRIGGDTSGELDSIESLCIHVRSGVVREGKRSRVLSYNSREINRGSIPALFR